MHQETVAKTRTRRPACLCRSAESFCTTPSIACPSKVRAACRRTTGQGLPQPRQFSGRSTRHWKSTPPAEARPFRYRTSIRSTTPFPPDDKAAAVTPNHGEFIGQYQQSERNHPEAEDRQEPEDAADGQQEADGDSEPARARHLELTPENRDFSRRHLIVLCCHRLERLTRFDRSEAPLNQSRSRAFGSLSPAKTANMRASLDDCEKPLREKASKKCEMLLCKAEKGSYRLRHSHKSIRSPVAQW